MDKLQFVYTSDRVDVVRCGECEYYNDELGECEHHEVADTEPGTVHAFRVDPDWFCADGERRDA